MTADELQALYEQNPTAFMEKMLWEWRSINRKLKAAGKMADCLRAFHHGDPLCAACVALREWDQASK